MAFDPTCQKNYLETGLFLTDSGRLLGLFRTQSDFGKPGVDFEQTYLNLHMAASDDGGKTFGPVYEIENLWGSSPFHALRLKSGKVLVTYGWRKEPFGIRARLCNGELSDIAEAEEIICGTTPRTAIWDIPIPYSWRTEQFSSATILTVRMGYEE